MKVLRIFPSKQFSNEESCDAFSVIELLVVIVTLALLAAVLLPALAASHPDSQSFQCLNNMKQLQLASILYAGDNGDLLPGNEGQSNPLGHSGIIGIGPLDSDWVCGSFGSMQAGLNGRFDNPPGAGTNTALLGVYGNNVPGLPAPLSGSIGGYTKNSKLYLCPADHTIDPFYKKQRVRSCSMNCYVGVPQNIIKNTGWLNLSYKIFNKYGDFNSKLPSSDCFVFTDENPQSLNDGFLLMSEPGGGNDRPAVNHGLASSFSFADGHTELHGWHDYLLGKSGTTDNQWLAAHLTVLK
jgi:type II secretory pathway pseudopilin PulG